MTRSTWILAAFALLLSGTTCSPPATALIVTLEAAEGLGESKLPAITNLRVWFTDRSSGDDREIPVDPGGPVFRGSRQATMVIRANGWAGPARVVVEALDENATLIGRGTANVTVIEAEQVPNVLRINPSDRQLNELSPLNQFFSTTASARQVAASPDGHFVATWVDDRAPPYKVFVRRFDHLGGPKLVEGVGKSTEQFAGSTDTDSYDMPAVAMKQDGSFVLVWKRIVEGADPHIGIYARTFATNGAPADEQRLSSDLFSAESPDVATLAGDTSVAVWQRQKTEEGLIEVVARHLDAKGPQGEAVVVGSYNEPPPSTRIDCGNDFHCNDGLYCRNAKCELLPGIPAVAATTSSYLVVWRELGKLKGRYFQQSGQSGDAFDVASSEDRVGHFDVAASSESFVVVWSGRKSDTDTGKIRLRRFNSTGKPLADDYVFSTFTDGAQHPAVASRSDGALLVAWSSIHSGIRARLLSKSGLPIGEDFELSTTKAGTRGRPSVAGSTNGFIIAFEDSSGVVDKDGSGIRGRLFAPGDYQPRNRMIGAVCEPSGCNKDLFCASTLEGRRCVSICTDKETCGTCRPPTEAPDKKICLY